MEIQSETPFQIVIRGLSKAYGDEQVLKNVSMTLSSDTRYCLMAPSGTGKTTLFRILMGLEKQDSGEISGLSGRLVSAVFQEDRLLEGCTALQNLRFVTGKRYTAGELTDAILRLLPADSLKKPVSGFSGGMKRRVAILRALLAPSDVVLMDEPFTGLDADTRHLTIRMIKEYTAGKLLLIATHGEEDAALLDARTLHLE